MVRIVAVSVNFPVGWWFARAWRNGRRNTHISQYRSVNTDLRQSIMDLLPWKPITAILKSRRVALVNLRRVTSFTRCERRHRWLEMEDNLLLRQAFRYIQGYKRGAGKLLRPGVGSSQWFVHRGEGRSVGFHVVPCDKWSSTENVQPINK